MTQLYRLTFIATENIGHRVSQDNCIARSLVTDDRMSRLYMKKMKTRETLFDNRIMTGERTPRTPDD